MGQQLIGRPVSQRAGFATLNTASSANAPDLSQYLGFTTPMATPQAPSANNTLQIARESPLNSAINTLGFRGYRSPIIMRNF